MPTYEYACSKCDEHFEVYQSFSDEPLKKHSGCGGKLSKVFGSVGIVLKGSGFYKTDNGSRSKSSTRSGASEGSGGADTSSDSSSDTATGKKSDKSPDSGSDTSTRKSGSSDSSSGSSASKSSSKAGAGT